MAYRSLLFPLLILCTLWLAACAASNTPLTDEQRQQLGKVYLHGASSAHDTYFDGDIRRGGASGALKGAGAGVINGLDGCLNSALGAGPLAPLVLAICTPLAVPAAVVQGGREGVKPLISDEDLMALKTQANQTLQSADLNGALVATVDEQSQNQPALSGYEISHGVLPPPEKHQSIEQLAAQWGYQTVLHIEVTKAGFETDDGRIPLMHFSMIARTHLVDTRNNKALHTGEYRYDSAPQPVSYWLSNDYQLLADEIIKGNKNIASDILKNIFWR